MVMRSTFARVAASRSVHSRREASRKYDWKVVSKNSRRPHSVPPVSRFDAAKCLIVSRVCVFRVAWSTPATAAS